jgi:O-antigen/teichoic acid export membrane protein
LGTDTLKRAWQDSTGRELQIRLFRNSSIMFGNRALAMAVSVVAVPIVVAKLGMVGYGTWECFMALSAITSIFQNALGGTLLWRSAAAFGSQDVVEIKRLVRLGAAATTTVFLIVSPVVIALRRDLVHLLNIPPRLHASSECILPALISLMILGGINETLGAAIRGCQRAGVATTIQTAAGVVNAVTVISGLALGAGLWSLLAGFAAAFLTTGAGFYICLCRLCGPVNIIPCTPRWSDIQQNARYLGCSLVGCISASLRGQTDMLVLASFASPVWTAYYALAARMASVVMEISNFFYVPAIAAVAAMHAKGLSVDIRRLYSNLMMIVPMSAGAVIMLVAAFPGRLSVLWIGKEVPQINPILWLLLLGTGFAVILTGPGTCVCKGVGRIEIETIYVSANLFLNLFLTIALVRSVGAIGTVIASGVSWAITSLLFVILVHRKLDLPRSATWRAGRTLLVVTAVVAVTRIIAGLNPAPATRATAFLSLLYLTPLMLAVYAILAIAVGIMPIRSIRAGLTQAVDHIRGAAPIESLLPGGRQC